ncbi:MAG: glutamate--tRNA ligase, partial [Alphaproteobacteria bacterium]
MTVVTRFAPSPTGVLHTGSARTALFCYLYAKNHGGKMLLRIEDTDRERSKQQYTDAIIEELTWLGIEWNDDIVMQSHNIERHKQVAYKLLEIGAAYKCYVSQEEIAKFREKHPNQKFQSPWRDKTEEDHPSDSHAVIRLKAPDSGSTLVKDLILGDIEFNNQEMDDMVLLRSDGTPTYMLAVVVDDHDMGVTHIIRGDDHLTNAFRQTHIYKGMGWYIPAFGHMPLIHDKHGKKLSKRTGALGVDEYRKLGYLPEAVANHLLRLGWSHGDDEIISMEQAIEWF